MREEEVLTAVERPGSVDHKGRTKRASLTNFADLWLDPHSGTSLWLQLYQQLRQATISRRLTPGTRLPATRILAQELGCSRNTILGAFEQLVAEGYLEGRIGSGTYVADNLPEEVTRPDRSRATPQKKICVARVVSESTAVSARRGEAVRDNG